MPPNGADALEKLVARIGRALLRRGEKMARARAAFDAAIRRAPYDPAADDAAGRQYVAAEVEASVEYQQEENAAFDEYYSQVSNGWPSTTPAPRTRGGSMVMQEDNLEGCVICRWLPTEGHTLYEFPDDDPLRKKGRCCEFCASCRWGFQVESAPPGKAAHA